VSALLDGVDWEIVGAFAALVLLEGLRRIPAGGLVVRAIGWSGWKPTGQAEPRDRWSLVSWWSPVAPALVLPPLVGPAISSDELAARGRAARRAAPWLAAAGGLTLASLVFGLPLATARAGALGFIGGALIVVALALVTATGGWWAVRRLQPPVRMRPMQMLGWCSPFASGRVLEGVYQAALAGASPAQALRALAGEEVFAEWARARAYDAVHGGEADPDLWAAAGSATLQAIVASEPRLAAGAGSYCPRCAAVWLVVRESCPDCAVPAVPVA
jgi:hypothetical protein